MPSSKELQKSSIKKLLKNFFSLFGYEIRKKRTFLDRWGDWTVEENDFEKNLLNKYEKITLPSRENLWSIVQSIKHIHLNNIEGDIVECGIYNGHTLSMISNILDELKLEKILWGYDTFEEGFIENTYTSKDKNIKGQKATKKNDVTYNYSIEEVIKNIKNNGNINLEKFKFIKGNILDTLNNTNNIPKKISFLRMDTDLYSLTKKQLNILYPKLSIGGVLHIDDYGSCFGVREAVDEYFKNQNIWLHRVDYTCRYLIKK